MKNNDQKVETPPIDSKIIYDVFSNIPLDIEGSNISCTGWIPSESDRKHIGDDFFDKAVKEGQEKNSKVLFTNVKLNWDSCDCGDGYGCSHPNYVYEIEITTEEKTHSLEMDGCGIIAYNEKRQTMIPPDGVSVYDFYRMCEIVGIKLELSEYAISLLNNHKNNAC